MADLVGNDVRAGARKIGLSTRNRSEERKARAVVEGVHVIASVLAEREILPVSLPHLVRLAARGFPRFDSGDRSFSALPKQELRRAGLVDSLCHRTREGVAGRGTSAVGSRCLIAAGGRSGTRS